MSIRAFPLSILGPTEWPAVVIFHPKPACLPFFNSQSQYAISASPHNNYMGCCKDQLSARHCPVYSTHRGQMDQLQTVCSALHCWWPGKLGTSSDTRMTEGRSWDLWHNQYFQNTSIFHGCHLWVQGFTIYWSMYHPPMVMLSTHSKFGLGDYKIVFAD